MSIGYAEMTAHDFNNYFSSCYAFRYFPEDDTVVAYRCDGISSGDSGRDALSSRARMRRIRDDGTLLTGSAISVRTLLESPNWFMHRFPVEYITTDDVRLLRVHLEPHDRRMRKGTSTDYLQYRGIMDQPVAQAPADVNRGLVSSRDTVAPRPYQLMLGVAKVLAFGAMPFMRRCITQSQATTKCKRAVRDLLVSADRETIVPAPNIAIVRHRTDRERGMVLNSGTYIGSVAVTNNRLVFTGRVEQYEDRTAATLAKRGLRDLALRIFADRVVWED